MAHSIDSFFSCCCESRSKPDHDEPTQPAVESEEKYKNQQLHPEEAFFLQKTVRKLRFWLLGCGRRFQVSDQLTKPTETCKATSDVELSWSKGIGRFKYCGLREDPFASSSPPVYQADGPCPLLPEMTTSESDALRTLQKRLSDVAVAGSRCDPSTLLRFLKEKKLDPAQAELFFREALAMRQLHGVDKALSTWNLELYEQCLAPWWPNGGFLGHSIDGRPVVLERFGRADIAFLVEKVPIEILLKIEIVHCLRTLAGVEEDSVRRGVPFAAAILISDLDGVGWNHFKPSVVRVIRQLFTLRHYLVPQTCKQVLVINAPALFVRVANSLKEVLVNPETAALVKVVKPCQTIHALREHMADELIPAYLGGSRKVDGDPFCSRLLSLGGTPHDAALRRLDRLMKAEHNKL